MSGPSEESAPGRGESDPIEDACRSIDEKESVDWRLTESKITGARDQASARALRDLERIAEVHRGFQEPPTDAPRAPRSESWGPLTILELSSAGQSGEVWRAWDAWLQREVALKFLVAMGKDGPDESALLEESRALARIRHPGVVNVYGIGAHGGRVGMWMEFLEGSTLEGEIDRRGPLPPSDVAKIGIDLCRALDAVVAAGLVHRDIKPANVILESGGRTVLTDFGLGKRSAISGREAWRSSGTPLFMAPELLAGEAASPRSDLYALGVTLRWALTGRAPFRSRTLQELRAEAEVGPSTRLRDERPDAPTALADAIERAMAPRADDRYPTPSQFAEALEASMAEPRVAHRASRWGRLVAVGVALLVGLSWLVLARLLPGHSVAPRGTFTIHAPPRTELNPYAGGIAISPNGRLVAFVADSTGYGPIWIRPLESLTPRRLEGTEGAYFLFWSPDSKELGFFAAKKLRKISIPGGAQEILCDAPDPRGATWGKDGSIVFAPRAAGGLFRVSSEGGTAIEIQRPDSMAQETALRWPHFLPDGERFFFVSLPPRDGKFDVFVANSTSDGRRRVMQAGCAPTVAGDAGIVVADNGHLLLQGFDYRRLKPKGAPVALARAPFSNQSVGQPLASASSNGIIVHLDQPLTRTALVMVDRGGRRRETVPLPPGRYEWGYPAPDGKRLFAGRRDSPTQVELWLVDLTSGQSRPFSLGLLTRVGGLPAWSPDGSRVAFSAIRTGRTNIYERGLDEAGEERVLYESDEQFKEVNAWSPDGKYLVFEQSSSKTSWDLWLLPLNPRGTAVPYLATRFNETAGNVSPDGRWLVYTSDQTGKDAIYVRSFPTPGAEVLVWDAPGRATWSRNGREILISHTSDGGIWSIPVSTEPGIRPGVPKLLFRSREALWTHPAPGRDEFLQVVPSGQIESSSITVDMNVRRPW